MNVLEIKAAVRERDGNKCVKCPMTNSQHLELYGRQLDVHRKVPGSAYSTAPGVCETRCRPCHRRAHRKFRFVTLKSGVFAQIALPAETVRLAKQLAVIIGVPMHEYVDSLLRPELERLRAMAETAKA